MWVAGRIRSDNNYNLKPINGKLTVEKAINTINFSALGTRTYGNNPFTLVATATSGLLVTFTSSDPSVASVSGNQVTIKAQGTATITASNAGDANHLPAVAEMRQLTVNRKDLTVTANNEVGTVSGANPAFSASFLGLVGSDTATTIGLTVNFTSSATNGSLPGDYVITPSGLTTLDNYNVTYVPGM